ncbi:solute carrier family 26 member 9-like [Latimeria chalumnae]|uniref:STAS domain-containing protein n=1 Tax=Latimeria chalumnae TaxID=7897 RepID=M3XJF0_LATCH|nr:PREDICTED: solute carrier family 26 member 9-like [Latimeria chalumnae]|eukprot:XP_014346537.1 PREDICTED: solute carrier family 26 member 9-like [Latimeria chalumnae]
MAHVKQRYITDRPVYSVPVFDEEFQKKSRTYPHGEKARKLFRCSTARLKAFVFRFFPILTWLPKYNFKQNGIIDVLVGISSGTIQVPQGMAYSLIGELPAINGLYSSFFPLIIYFFLGSIHQMVPGTFAVISIMVGTVCIELAPESDFQTLNRTTNQTITDIAAMEEARMRISGTLTCLTAIIQLALGFMQFGFITIYLSEAFVRGFMTAAGLQILISVFKYIFGVTVPPFNGPLATIYTLIDTFGQIPQTNVASFIIALVCCVVLFIVKELNLRYKHKIRFPIPIEIIVVIIATAISGSFNFPEKYHIDIVGSIPLGLPAPHLPQVHLWGRMIGTAFSLAIVGYVVNVAMGRTLALKYGYNIDSNQEMLALGFGNLFGSFFKIHVICCALSVTLAVDGAGGTSQIASFFVMLVVLITLVSLGAYLEPLPKAVLGALIAVNLKNSVKQLADPYYLWQKSKLDCCVWIVSFLSTFLLGLPYGVAVGVGFSLLVVVFNTQFRNGSTLGQVNKTDIYKNPKVYNKVEEPNGTRIITYCAPLYFANAELFKQKVIKKTGVDPGKILLARKKFLKHRDKENKKNRKPSQYSMTNKAFTLQEPQGDLNDGPPMDSNNNSTAVSSTAVSNNTFASPNGIPGDPGNSSKWVSDIEKNEDPVLMAPPSVGFHTLILDLGGVCFVDLMGIRVLGKMCTSYQKIGINFYLANVQAQVYEDIEKGGVFEDTGLDRSHLFLTVQDAVLHALETADQSKGLDQIQIGSGSEAFADEDHAEREDLEEAMFGSMFSGTTKTAL